MNSDAATSGRRLISVHVLGQSVFCERAGVQAAASGPADRPIDAAPLDYMPEYERQRIERELNRRLNWLGLWAGLTLVSFVASIALRPLWGPSATWVSLAGIVLFGMLAISVIPDVMTLAERVRLARSAVAASPPNALDTEFPVNWWRMLADGWESSIPQDEAYLDEKLGLVGAPWRVLRRGDVRIPVLRSTSDKQRLRRRHRVRIAAYCRLIEACEGGMSPYGVVIFASTYDGIASPVKPDDPAWLESSLERLRATVDDPDSAVGPTREEQCKKCRFGKPREYIAGKSETTLPIGEVLHPFPKQDDHGVWRHSDCGDRYRWVPRHEKAERLGMVGPAS